MRYSAITLSCFTLLTIFAFADDLASRIELAVIGLQKKTFEKNANSAETIAEFNKATHSVFQDYLKKELCTAKDESLSTVYGFCRIEYDLRKLRTTELIEGNANLTRYTLCCPKYYSNYQDSNDVIECLTLPAKVMTHLLVDNYSKESVKAEIDRAKNLLNTAYKKYNTEFANAKWIVDRLEKINDMSPDSYASNLLKCTDDEKTWIFTSPTTIEFFKLIYLISNYKFDSGDIAVVVTPGYRGGDRFATASKKLSRLKSDLIYGSIDREVPVESSLLISAVNGLVVPRAADGVKRRILLLSEYLAHFQFLFCGTYPAWRR